MDLLIGDVFSNAARAVPSAVAAAHGDATMTFGELERRARQVAADLMLRGVGRGDRVVVAAATSLDTIPLFAALAKLGAAFAPVNPALSADELAAQVGVARPALVVVDPSRAEDVEGAVPIDRLGGDATSTGSPGVTEHDPHVIFFTSGSTGRPKGVVLSHRVNALRTHPGALLEPRGAMVCPYPLFHMGAWTIALQQWQARDRVVFTASDAGSICEAVERHRATRLNAIPAVWQRVIDHAPGGLPTLRFADSGTSATPAGLLDAIAAVAPNAHLRVFYGSTEAGSVAALHQPDFARKPGSCGVPAPWTDVRVDADHELWVRGPLLFDGYFDDPVSTGEAIVDGWYRTGDLAEIDEDGYLSIIGRGRDVIRTGGETVAPAEVEAVVAGVAGVGDVAVVGLPDPQWGEVVCAVIVATAGVPPPTLADVRAACEGRLARHKHPRRIEVVASIPRTVTTGQVQRRLLVERLGNIASLGS